MKKLLILVLTLWLFGCSKEKGPVNNNRSEHEKLSMVKSGANGDMILNENIYAPDGQIKTRIDYRNHSLGIIGSRAELTYNNGRLIQTEIQMNLSGSINGTQYSYSKTSFEYNNAGLVTQRNNYLKVADQYELSSFSVFTYNNKQLPSLESRFMPDGTLYGYSTYEYDAAGNVILQEDYSIGQSGASPVLTIKKSFKHDNKNNPYTRVYHTVENLPFSINNNNITEITAVNYTLNPQGISSTSTTSYSSYNNKNFPTNMNENGNAFILQYK